MSQDIPPLKKLDLSEGLSALSKILELYIIEEVKDIEKKVEGLKNVIQSSAMERKR
jgi:hypothetical protein